MINFLTALNTAFASSAVSALVTGLYPFPAPQLTAYPLITWELLGNSPNLQTFDSLPEEISIRFGVWSLTETPLEAVTIRDAIRTWLDAVDLTIAGGYLITADWENEVLVHDPDGGFEYYIDYRFLIENT